MVCVCTEQTGLLYLCRAAQASSSSQRGPFTYPFWDPHLHSSFSFPPLRIKWLFVLPQRCLSLISPPLPSPSSPSFSQGMKGYFWEIDLVCLAMIPKECSYLCLYATPPLSSLGCGFLQEPGLVSPGLCISADVK